MPCSTTPTKICGAKNTKLQKEGASALGPAPASGCSRSRRLTLLQGLQAAQLAVIGRLMQGQPALLVGLCEILPRLDHRFQGLFVPFLDGLQHGVHRPVTARAGSLTPQDQSRAEVGPGSLSPREAGRLVAGGSAGRGTTRSCLPLLVWNSCSGPLQPVPSSIRRVTLPNPHGCALELGPDLGPDLGPSSLSVHQLSITASSGLSPSAWGPRSASLCLSSEALM